LSLGGIDIVKKSSISGKAKLKERRSGDIRDSYGPEWCEKKSSIFAWLSQKEYSIPL